jgi:hypothetical protein
MRQGLGKRKWFLISILFLCAGCASAAYKEVFRDTPAYNRKDFSAGKEIAYKATLRAIIAKNFMVEKEDKENSFILAKRSFQQGKRTTVLLLQAKLVSDEVNKTALYLNALQTTERAYVADRTRFFLWIIPLPGGGGKEGSNIKEKEEVVEDKTFYQKFFALIDEELQKSLTAECDKDFNEAPVAQDTLQPLEPAALEK